MMMNASDSLFVGNILGNWIDECYFYLLQLPNFRKSV